MSVVLSVGLVVAVVLLVSATATWWWARRRGDARLARRASVALQVAGVAALAVIGVVVVGDLQWGFRRDG